MLAKTEIVWPNTSFEITRTDAVQVPDREYKQASNVTKYIPVNSDIYKVSCKCINGTNLPYNTRKIETNCPVNA